MISPFLCGRKGVSFGWLMDSIFGQPLQGRVNPVVMTAPTMGRRGQWVVQMETVCRDTNIYSSVNSKEEKKNTLYYNWG